MASVGPRTPRSVDQITKSAQDYEFNALIGLKYWLRCAATLLKEAEIYEREGDDEQTYWLLFRHAHLILSNLARHPESNTPQFKRDFSVAKEDVKRNLQKLDELKPRINQRYERYLRQAKEREVRREAALRERRASQEQYLTHEHLVEDQIVRQIQASEHSDLAVQLAQEEMSRRAALQRKSSHDGRTATTQSSEDFSQMMQEIRHRVDDTERSELTHSTHNSHVPRVTSQYKYPSVRNLHTSGPSLRYEPKPLTMWESVPESHLTPPDLPAKPPSISLDSVPARPDKVPLQPRSSEISPPKSTYTFKPAAYLEDGSPLRTLFLPPTLRTTFLRIAHSNTLANLETCAFLAGTLVANALFVSQLIVPAQTATSDTCEMINESQLFDYVDSQTDLMVVGWIHTHPRQSCFMSSRDLHTHSGYQMMLAESVAIVCAPNQGDTSHGGDWGVFRLTDPPGKKAILTCNKPGIFHPHEVDNIYTDALRPGHVVEAAGLEFDVVDLRDKL